MGSSPNSCFPGGVFLQSPLPKERASIYALPPDPTGEKEKKTLAVTEDSRTILLDNSVATCLAHVPFFLQYIPSVGVMETSCQWPGVSGPSRSVGSQSTNSGFPGFIGGRCKPGLPDGLGFLSVAVDAFPLSL